MRKFLIAGNWKMNTTPGEAKALAAEISRAVKGFSEESSHDFGSGAISLLVCPPFTNIPAVAEELKGSPVQTGAQNCYHEAKGAFTGEISPGMLRELGCSHVIVGHSERRTIFSESNEMITKKILAALRENLVAIFCVGETLHERETKQTAAVLDRQLRAVLPRLKEEFPHGIADKVVIAYEPVWAIGTGKSATPQQAQEAHEFIRKILQEYFGTAARSIKILYGGSVTADNSREIFSNPDTDGGLIGGASLKADSFVSIVRSAYEVLSGR